MRWPTRQTTWTVPLSQFQADCYASDRASISPSPALVREKSPQQVNAVGRKFRRYEYVLGPELAL